jgi:glyoxylase-like metal-dependent hydrolase (beta-lactamase superfamily II)
MKKKRLLPFVMLFCFAASPLLSQTEEDRPIRIQKISERVLVLMFEEGNSNITAINSQKGIVVCDTEASPVLAKSLRKRIEKEFPGKSFAYVINTHSHGDHTYGNQVFSDAQIIGHQNCPEEMREREASVPKMASGMKAVLGRLEARLKTLEGQPEKHKAMARQVFYFKAMSEGLGEGFRLTPPHLTFEDRTTLDLGDLTLHLIYFGTSHSKSDILIFCPEEHLLLTGDLFGVGYDPYIDSERVPFLPRWIESLEGMLAPENNIQTVVPGHEEFLTTEILKKKLNYIREQKESFEGKKSALNIFKDVYAAEGVQSAVAKLKQMHSAPDQYYTLFNELDTFAYRKMQNSKLEDALTIFTTLTMLFPDNATAFDSLGEVYLRLEKTDKAISAFKKSLELNPKNRNAKTRLSELEGKKD